ncbi:bifunctional DNA primase/polymerase, partial [Chloroflexota bacterium]
MSENRMLKAALAYAERGWCPVPLHTPHGTACSCGHPNCGTSAGKHPRIIGWEQKASTDPVQIQAWWSKWPKANIGIACGPSGLVSVDVDIKDGIDGRETWRDLQQEHAFTDDGALVNLTGSGGQQLIFSSNGRALGNTARKLGPGIDTRGSGGLFVAPPSLHYSGRLYTWDVAAHPLDHAAAPIPE